MSGIPTGTSSKLWFIITKEPQSPQEPFLGFQRKSTKAETFSSSFFLLKTNKGKHKHIPIQKHFWRATNPQGSKPLASPIRCCKMLDIISASVGLPHAIIKEGNTTTKIRLSSTLPPTFVYVCRVCIFSFLKIFKIVSCMFLVRFLKLRFLCYLQLWTIAHMLCLSVWWQDNFMICPQLTNWSVGSVSMVPWLMDIWNCQLCLCEVEPWLELKLQCEQSFELPCHLLDKKARRRG